MGPEPKETVGTARWFALLVAPFAYLEIITSTAAGWLFFSQVPDRVTFTGVAILICSSAFIAWRR